jgi:hypothetical protein
VLFGVSESGNAALADQPGVFVIDTLTVGSFRTVRPSSASGAAAGTKRALSNVRARLIPEMWNAFTAFRCSFKITNTAAKRNEVSGPKASSARHHRDTLNRTATAAPFGVTERATRFPDSRALCANANASIAPPSVMAPATAIPGIRFGRLVCRRVVV